MLAVAVPTAVSNGTCPLIWPGLTEYKGAGIPLMVTEVPASERGQGAVETLAVDPESWDPYSEKTAPGASLVLRPCPASAAGSGAGVDCGASMRTRLLPASATKMFPRASTATDAGLRNDAKSPVAPS